MLVQHVQELLETTNVKIKTYSWGGILKVWRLLHALHAQVGGCQEIFLCDRSFGLRYFFHHLLPHRGGVGRSVGWGVRVWALVIVRLWVIRLFQFKLKVVVLLTRVRYRRLLVLVKLPGVPRVPSRWVKGCWGCMAGWVGCVRSSVLLRSSCRMHYVANVSLTSSISGWIKE